MAQKNEHHGQSGASTAGQSQPQHAPEHAQKSAGHIAAGPLTQLDPWQHLKSFTRARIALGRVGSSLPTNEILDFGLSHAMARDAVHLALDAEALSQHIRQLGFDVTQVRSRAPDRQSYLIRPDWGRRLDDASYHMLNDLPKSNPIDFLLVVGDGLSSLAVERHVVPLLRELQKLMPPEWEASKVVVATQARVALADEAAERMGARLVAMLIGERPGLSSPDSLGVYLTYNPRVGCSDADRNCISNIRPEGLSYAEAAGKLMWLAKEAMRMKVSGVALKDESNVKEIGANAALPDANASFARK